MIQKYFPFDKNYLLERAQLSIEHELIAQFVEDCKKIYQTKYNPLGLVDDTVLLIREYQLKNTTEFSEMYRLLCAIYRYKYGNNQLEFLFDGSDHLIKYEQDWRAAFRGWTVELGASKLFLRSVFELTVFYSNRRKGELAAGRIKSYIEQHFDVKLYRYKGLVEAKVA